MDRDDPSASRNKGTKHRSPYMDNLFSLEPNRATHAVALYYVLDSIREIVCGDSQRTRAAFLLNDPCFLPRGVLGKHELVPREGVAPSRLSAPGFEAGVSAVPPAGQVVSV